MPQVLKDEVRARMVAAALEVFAERGYARATMTAIAERAGTGAASTYRYFASKRELFDAAVPPEIARQFEALLERRVRGLARFVITNVPSGAEDLGEEMLRFWIEHRLAVVVLLDRAEGSPFSDFGDRFVEQLLSATVAHLRAETPKVRVTPAARFVLARIFENTRRMLAAILETHDDERALRNAIEGFWSYQIPGLRGFAEWVRTRSR